MKLPTSAEGAATGEENSLANNTENIDENSTNPSPSGALSQPLIANFPTENLAETEEPDFSSFMWMEHQEQYDLQVWKELDEEVQFQLFQESVEAETNGYGIRHEEEENYRGFGNQTNYNGSGNYHHHHRSPASSSNYNRNSGSFNSSSSNSSGLANNATDNLSGDFSRVLSLNYRNSKLNPNAPEFVPMSSK